MDTLSLTLPPLLSLIALGALCIVMIILTVVTVRLSRRVTRLTSGSNGQDLEATIARLQKDTQVLQTRTNEIAAQLRELDARTGTSIRGVATVRFNPFQGDGSGGNQSFATALIDEHGDGVVLLGLYSRERMRMYAKPIEQFASALELADEEQEAVTHARQRLDTAGRLG